MNHINEEAELYALGLLEPEERARVDEHVLICDPCVRRLARAEATVLSMVDSSVRVESAPPELAARIAGIQAPPRATRTGTRRFGWASAIAAVFALSTGVLTQQHLALVSAVHADGDTIDAMVHSHFAHAQFLAPGGAPIDAKVLYDRHGSWYDVIASPGSTTWSVTVQRPGAPERIIANRFVARGEAVYLHFSSPGLVSQLELRDAAGKVLGAVKPLIASEKE